MSIAQRAVVRTNDGLRSLVKSTSASSASSLSSSPCAIDAAEVLDQIQTATSSQENLLMLAVASASLGQDRIPPCQFDIGPADLERWFQAAKRLMDQGDHEGALEIATRLALLDAADPRYLRLCAGCLHAGGRLREAAAMFEFGLGVAADAQAALALAQCLESLRPHDAFKAARQCLALASEDQSMEGVRAQAQALLQRLKHSGAQSSPERAHDS